MRGSNGAQAALALIDQLIVSGTTFLTMLMLGRLTGPHELGVFALVMTLYYLALAVQESLITVPYTVFGARLSGVRHRRYAGAALFQSAAWSVCASTILGVAAATLYLAGQDEALARVVGVIAIVLPFWLLREFARRFLFAHMQVAKVVAMSIVGGGTQLVLICGFAYAGNLSAATALGAIGAASGIVGFGWLGLSRCDFDAHSARRMYFLRKNWILGRWLLASQATPLLAGSVLLWQIMAWLGPTAIGVYAACDAILRFANPMIIAFTNVLTPQVAAGFQEGGKAQVRRIVWKSNLLLSVYLCGFALLMVVAGDWIMRHSFGNEYQGAWALLVTLGINQLVNRLSIAPGRALLVVEQSNLIMFAEFAALAVSLIAAPLLLPFYGVLGAPLTMLAGSVAMSSMMLGYYLAAMRDAEREPLFPMEPLMTSGTAK
jgi:O-antigen/teichoic acid export membrane protein